MKNSKTITLSRNILLLSVIALIAGCGSSGIEKYTTPGETTSKQFEDYRDNGGLNYKDKWGDGFKTFGIDPLFKNGILHDVELTIYYKILGSDDAVSPKMIRSTLSDYCGIEDSAWNTSDLGAQGISQDKKMTCGYSFIHGGTYDGSYLVSMSIND